MQQRRVNEDIAGLLGANMAHTRPAGRRYGSLPLVTWRARRIGVAFCASAPPRMACSLWVAAPVDYLVWTQSIAALAEGASEDAQAPKGSKSKEL